MTLVIPVYPEYYNSVTLMEPLQISKNLLALGVGGTLRYLQISVAWVFFGGKCTPDKGSETIFGLLAFFINCSPKKWKITYFLFFKIIYLPGSWIWYPDITNSILFHYLKEIPSTHVFFWPYFQKTSKSCQVVF